VIEKLAALDTMRLWLCFGVMKIKIFVLLLLCMAIWLVVAKQNVLIKVPKEERSLIKIHEKVKEGKVKEVKSGGVLVFDDDTEMRLFAVDVLEFDQECTIVEVINDETDETRTELTKCGEDSKNKLLSLIKNNKISCVIKGRDIYDTLYGECTTSVYNKRTEKRNKVNLNKEMVLSGNAVALRSVSDEYAEDENKAKQEGKGIWGTTFDTPSDFRKKVHKNDRKA